MHPFETIYTEKKVIACDGGRGAMGHPRVFLNMGAFDFTDCPYCSRRFVLKALDNKGPKPEPKDIQKDIGRISAE